MRLYLDTSALVSIFFEEERTQTVTNLVASAEEAISLSDFGIGEFSAVVSRAFRSGDQTETEALETQDDFDDWSVNRARIILTSSEEVHFAIGFVRQFDLKLLFPDALHLALCRRANAKLVTGDKRQATAATALRIPVTVV